MLVLMGHDSTYGPERVHHTLLQISMVGSLTPRFKITIIITMSIIIIIITISGTTSMNNNVSVCGITISEMMFLMLVIVVIINHVTILHKSNHDCHQNHIAAHGA